MRREEDREKVLVPVRRRGQVAKKELPEKPSEPPRELGVREMPRRWHIY